jgi:hypothetical protein
MDNIDYFELIRHIEVITGESNPDKNLLKAWEALEAESLRRKENRKQFIAKLNDGGFDSEDDCEGILPRVPTKPIQPILLRGGKKLDEE